MTELTFEEFYRNGSKPIGLSRTIHHDGSVRVSIRDRRSRLLESILIDAAGKIVNYEKNSVVAPILFKICVHNTKTIGCYAILKTIGHGSTCKVKLAINVETGESCAIKIINSNVCTMK